MPTNEHDLTRDVAAELRRRMLRGEPIHWLKVHGGPYQRAGVHDFWLCVGGLFVTLELKHPTDWSSTMTPLQLRELERVERARGFAYGDVRSVAAVAAILDLVLGAARDRGLWDGVLRPPLAAER